LLATALNVALS